MKNTPVLLASLLLSGCIPVIVGGGAATVGTLSMREKGVSGTLSDSQLSSKLKLKLYGDASGSFTSLIINVQNGEILLAGSVPTSEAHLKALRLIWETRGVKRVIDQISVRDKDKGETDLKDSWITTQIKSALLFDSEVQSLNYSIETVHHIVYLMGIAQDEAELKKVTDHARKIPGVEKVISYVQLKDDPDLL